RDRGFLRSPHLSRAFDRTDRIAPCPRNGDRGMVVQTRFFSCGFSISHASSAHRPSSARCARSRRPPGTGGPIDAMGRAARNGNFVAASYRWSTAMPQPNDLSRSLVALDQNSTLIAVVELSHSSWLVGGVVPGIERQPRKKLEPNPERLLALLHRWRDEA